MSSLVISACLTPTDPVVSAAVIGQLVVNVSASTWIVHPAPFGSLGGRFAVKSVPLPIRQLLVAESASNDGLAYPFLSISIYLTTETSRATAFEKWIVISCLCVQKDLPRFVSQF